MNPTPKVQFAKLFSLVNAFVGYEQMKKSSHMRCTDHSVQIGAAKLMKLSKEVTAKLREALVKIRQSKVRRQAFRCEAAKF
jgi:hypothetical protein